MGAQSIASAGGSELLGANTFSTVMISSLELSLSRALCFPRILGRLGNSRTTGGVTRRFLDAAVEDDGEEGGECSSAWGILPLLLVRRVEAGVL